MFCYHVLQACVRNYPLKITLLKLTGNYLNALKTNSETTPRNYPKCPPKLPPKIDEIVPVDFWEISGRNLILYINVKKKENHLAYARRFSKLCVLEIVRRFKNLSDFKTLLKERKSNHSKN